ncbi:MAG: Dihydrodipicolinate reductase, N-terminus [Actinomycetota bacterium]
MTIKVAILGAKGRMGAEVVKAVSNASDLELVASIDQNDDFNMKKKLPRYKNYCKQKVEYHFV